MDEIRLSHEEFKNQIAVMTDFISHQLYVFNNNRLAPYGLTYAQAKMLVRLSDSPDGRLSRCEFVKMGLRNSTVTGILANLERGGFVRAVDSRTDARAKFIEITDKGRQVQQTALKNIIELEEIITAGFSNEEKLLFSMLLKRASENVKEINLVNQVQQE